MRPLSMMGAFRIMGPAFLVSVALVDPGNWATSIEAGSKFGYELVWVVVASNLIAILLQTLAARLGIVTGKHLAQICRESYPFQVCALLWVLCEISIVALDLTMLLGTAIGLNLLLGWPLLPCIILTSLDALLLVLLVPAQGVRKSEALTIGLLAVVVACFLVDLLVSRPPLASVVSGLFPRLRRESVYTAVSLLGANVMPHNFYLHSALVSGQAAKAAAAAAAQAGAGGGGESTRQGEIRALCLYNFLDIGAALGVALVINVAVLLVSAATFHSAGVVVHTLQAAHDLMEQTLSSSIAPAAFGTALLCAGQLSTFTGTIAGQVVLQGFLNIHISTWLRRLITRTAAIIPAAVLQYVYGDRGTYKFLLIAQVVLALQLPVTLVPLIKATSSRQLMGPHASSRLLAAAAWGATGLVFLANLMLFVTQMLPEVSSGRGILDKDGPLDAWIDRVASLVYSDPLRAVGLVGLLVAAAAFLALQLWMLATPLRVNTSSDLTPDAATAPAATAPPPPRGGGDGGGAVWDENKGPGVAAVGPSESHDGRARRGWFGLWGSGGGGGGGGAARGNQQWRRFGTAQVYGHAGGDSYGTAVAPSSGQSEAPWQKQLRQQQQEQQWNGYASWNRATAAAADPFAAAATAGAAGFGGGGGWVVPSSVIAKVISSGPLPFDLRSAAADAALLPLPWRPRERYRRRRSGCFCSEAETGSDDGGGNISSSGSDSLSDSDSVAAAAAAARSGDDRDTHASGAGVESSLMDPSRRRRRGDSGSSSSPVTATAAQPAAIWASRPCPPQSSAAAGALAGEATVDDQVTEASGTATRAQVAHAFGAAAAAATEAAIGLGYPKSSGLVGLVTHGDGDVALLLPPLASSGAAAAAEATAAGGSGKPHAVRPQHPVSRGSRPKFAKVLEDFWAVFYDSHGRPVCELPRKQQQQMVEAPRRSLPQGSFAAQVHQPPLPHPHEELSRQQEGQQSEQWHRQGRLQASPGRGGGFRSRGGLRPAGAGGDDDEGWIGWAATAAESASGTAAAAAAAGPPSSPLLCTHTESSHLCMGCSQALFGAVRQCLLALEQLEGVEAAVWGSWPLQLVLPPDNQTFHYHRAVLLATRNADFPALQVLCAGTFTSRMDQSRFLASTPLTQAGAVVPPPLPTLSAAVMAASPASDILAAFSGAGNTVLAAAGVAAASTRQVSHAAELQRGQQQQQLQSGVWCVRRGGRSSIHSDAAEDPLASWQPWYTHHPQQGSRHSHPNPETVSPRPAGAKGAACLPTHGSRDAAPEGWRSSASWDQADDAVALAIPSFDYHPDTGSGNSAGRHGHGSGASPVVLSGLVPAAASQRTPLPPPPQAPTEAPPLQVLRTQPRSGLGFPTVSSWCLFGPAAFVSFGLWSVFTLAQWCTADSRPAHWGQYASVLNRLQGVLRDARLDPMAAALAGPAAPSTDVGPGVGTACITSGVAAAAPPPPPLLALSGRSHAGQQQPSPHAQQQPLPSPQHQHQQRHRVGSGQRGYSRGPLPSQPSRHQKQLQQQGQQRSPPQPPPQPAAVLPGTALRLCPEHMALLRWELLQQLEGMEASLLERRGPADTKAGQVAFPKAKEIMASVMRRYRRHLGAGAGGGGVQGAPGGFGGHRPATGDGTGDEGAPLELATM